LGWQVEWRTGRTLCRAGRGAGSPPRMRETTLVVILFTVPGLGCRLQLDVTPHHKRGLAVWVICELCVCVRVCVYFTWGRQKIWWRVGEQKLTGGYPDSLGRAGHLHSSAGDFLPYRSAPLLPVCVLQIIYFIPILYCMSLSPCPQSDTCHCETVFITRQ
jgi:hypothetical protein